MKAEFNGGYGLLRRRLMEVKSYSMRLKEFRETEIWKAADFVILFNRIGNELEIKSEVQRRKYYNREVINYRSMMFKGIKELEIYLDIL